MIIGVVKRILKEDLSKQEKTPNWVDNLLSPLNQFIEVVAQALQNSLTMKDNFSGRETTISVTDSLEAIINPGANNRVRGVVLMSASGEVVTGFGWNQRSDGQIAVTLKFLTSGAQRSCVFQLLF